MLDQGDNMEDLMEGPLDHKGAAGRAITWKETWGALSGYRPEFFVKVLGPNGNENQLAAERKMLHPPDQEPNQSHLVSCRCYKQQITLCDVSHGEVLSHGISFFLCNVFRLLCIISASFHQIIVDGGNSYRG